MNLTVNHMLCDSVSLSTEIMVLTLLWGVVRIELESVAFGISGMRTAITVLGKLTPIMV